MLIASSQIKAKNRMRSSGQRLRSDFTNQQKQGFLHNGLNLKCFASVSGSTAISYATAKHTLSAGDPFDSDSYLILIDNCCSACITNEIKDFNCKPVKVNANINGVGGGNQAHPQRYNQMVLPRQSGEIPYLSDQGFILCSQCAM